MLKKFVDDLQRKLSMNCKHIEVDELQRSPNDYIQIRSNAALLSHLVHHCSQIQISEGVFYSEHKLFSLSEKEKNMKLTSKLCNIIIAISSLCVVCFRSIVL